MVLGLFSNDPSLQLILEDIILSALAGRAVVHRQVLVCPRLAPPPAAPVPPAAAAAASPALGPAYSSSGQAANTPPTSRGLVSSDSLASSADRSSGMGLARNPLDDFLVVQIAACYLDQRHTGQSVQPPLLQPGDLPALFMTFSRPYAVALAAAGLPATAAGHHAPAAPGTGPRGSGAGGSAPLPQPSAAAASVSIASPRVSQHTHHSGSSLAKSPQPLAVTTSSGAFAAHTPSHHQKMSKSPSLGSLFGSLGKPSWMRPGNAAVAVGSPGPSPRWPFMHSNAAAATTAAAPGAMAAGVAAPPPPPPSAFAVHDSSLLHGVDLDTSHRGPSVSSAGNSVHAHNSNGCHDSGATIAAIWGAAEPVNTSSSLAPPPPPSLTDRPPPLRLPAASAAALEDLCGRLRMELSVLAQVPVAVTLLSLDGRVLYQNGRSVAFMGYAVDAPVAPGLDLTDPEHPLQRIFAADPPALESMWEAVYGGKVWSGLVCMPPRVELSQAAAPAPLAAPCQPLLLPRGASDSSLHAAAAHAACAGAGALASHGSTDVASDAAALSDAAAVFGRHSLLSLRRGDGTGSSNGAGSATGSGNGFLPIPQTGTVRPGAAGVPAAATTAVPVPGVAAVLAAANAAASPQDFGQFRRPGPGGFFSPPGPLPLSAIASAAASAAAGDNAGAVGAGRPGCLPRNTSAPLFRGCAGVGSPLPSVLESEACTGSASDAAALTGYGAAGSTFTSGAADAASGGFPPFGRSSWGLQRTASGCPPLGDLAYCSSPLGSVDPLSAAAAAGAAPYALRAAGGGAAAAGDGPLLPQQHLVPGQRRTRIHRSNSLAKTEHALDGSYRAMRLAQASQGLMAPGPVGVHYGSAAFTVAGVGVGASAGGATAWSYGAAASVNAGSYASADGLLQGSPRRPIDALLAQPAACGVGGATAAADSGAGGPVGAVSLAVTTSAPVPSGGARREAPGSAGAMACQPGSAAAALTAPGGSAPWHDVCPPAGHPPASRGSHHDLRMAPSPVGRAASAPGPDALARTGSGASAAAAAALQGAAGSGGGCCWHEIQANLLPDPVSGESQLLLMSQDVTAYVAAELEVRQVLDAEHRILESIFPRHVLEAMTLDKRRASAALAASGSLGLTPRPLERSVSNASALASTPSHPASLSNHPLTARAVSCGGGHPLHASGPPPQLQIAPTASESAASAAAAAVGVSVPSARGGAAEPSPACATAVPALIRISPIVAARADLQPPPQQLPPPQLQYHQQQQYLPPPASQRSVSAHLGAGAASGHLGISSQLGASASLASYNYSVYTGAGAYDSCDDRGSCSHSLYAYSEHIRTLDASSSARLRSPRLLSAGACLGGPPQAPQAAAGGRAVGPAPAAAGAAGTLAAGQLSSGGGGGASGGGGSFGGRASPGAARLRGGIASMGDLQQYMARSHEQVTVLFADIASFTSMCGQVPPDHVMAFLNDLFTTFDQLVEKHRVYKVETIGDCYMVCGGLMEEDAEGFRSVTEAVDPLHAHKVFAFACDMLAAAAQVPMPGSGEPVKLRVGLHSGPVMSGIVGLKMPRFCLFGDTVNTASRMESCGVAGSVHVSASTRALLGDCVDGFVPTDGVTVKGKGTMYTYLYHPLEATAASGPGGEAILDNPTPTQPPPLPLPVAIPAAIARELDGPRRPGMAPI
ncbi:hypothetical protein GPECTOR_5g43 [Gonium pectorale]|uniref:Guanylate cyclase domain-containing protein n=1 Tax=Gonium pectorale TaxID=33097 RepID=A0A150GXD5_GONPE|nr:hypothetical protein GPECTOR_5g43 [Gonium pectorale]|eukprot:KXZ54348.1 hypothetical protein GPECTOR_5g43 [Gonium pectorale]